MGLTGAAMAAMQALPAFAASYAEDVVGQLAGLGYENITIEATWLGRIRILATRSDGAREIVLNPRTGEILRDVWTPTSGDGVRRVILDDVDEDIDIDGDGDGDGDNDGDNSGSDDDADDNDNSGGSDDGDDASDDSDNSSDDASDDASDAAEDAADDAGDASDD